VTVIECPMCRTPVLTADLRGSGWLEVRCHSRRCTARPLLRVIVRRGVVRLRSLDKAPPRVVRLA